MPRQMSLEAAGICTVVCISEWKIIYYNIFRKMNLFWEIRINYCVLFRVSSSINKRVRLKYKALNCIYITA